GIKTFFHYDIQNLQLRDESFEPRFEVELAKAGDASMVGIFCRQSRATRLKGLMLADETDLQSRVLLVRKDVPPCEGRYTPESASGPRDIPMLQRVGSIRVSAREPLRA